MDSPLCSVASTSTDAGSLDTPMVESASRRLSEMPETLIRAIYDHLTYKDVLRSQRVSKRLRKILASNAHYLSRPSVSEMSIKMGVVEKRLRPLGRIQPRFGRNSNSSRRILHIAFERRVAMPHKASTCKWKEFSHEDNLSGDGHEMSPVFLNALSESLKQVDVNGRLSFCGIAIDSTLCERLTRNWVHISDARDLMFTLCRFRLSTEQFRDLLRRTNANKLNLELSHFDETILNDYVLEVMSECREFSASATHPSYYPGFTDRTLNRWATQESLPSRIYLHNICANFTLDGVLTIINALQMKHTEMFTAGAAPSVSSTTEPRYQWNFGCVRLTQDGASILELMSTPGFVVHATNSDVIPNVIDISLSVKSASLSPLRRYNTSSPTTINMQLVMDQHKTN